MNKMNITKQGEIIPIFPTPIVRANIGRYFTKKEHQLFLTDIPMWKDEQAGMFNHQSKDFYLFDSHADILGDVKKFCEHELKRYLENIEGVDTDLAGLRITQSWLNKTKPGEYHHPHFHTNSYISAVLYIKCLPNDGINFDNRMYGMFNNIEFPIKKTTQWNARSTGVDVEEGDLLLFPSWITHFVNVNETENKERISLAFNTFPIGEMGNYNGGSLLTL